MAEVKLPAPAESVFRAPHGSSLKVSETEMDLPTFPVLVRDWSRIRRRVADLANPISWARDLAWSCVSLGAGCLLALIPWLPAYKALGTGSQLEFAWVSPGLVIAGVACAVVATICFVLHSRVDRVIRRDVSHVLEEMDEIQPPTDADRKEAERVSSWADVLATFRRLREVRR